MSLLAGICQPGSLLGFMDERQPELADRVASLYESLTDPQREVWDSDSRFKLLCSGRRFGKTYLCIARLITWAASKPNSLNWYVTANYRMAKQIAWRQLKNMVPTEICVKRNETDLLVELSMAASFH